MKRWISLVNVPELDQYIELTRHAESPRRSPTGVDAMRAAYEI